MFFLLSTEPLLLFTILFGVLSLKPVFLLLELSLSRLLPLLLLQVANEALSRDLLALVALPDALRHPLEIRTEQVVRLLTRATIDEIARVLALEAVVRILK